MSRICVDCGHSLNSYDYGAVGIRNESDLTREVGRRVINLFRNNGHEVIDCTVDNCSSLSDSLYRRYSKANSKGADYYISIHFNAFNGSAEGTEILYASSPDDKMIRILNNIVSLGYTNRGLKKDTRGLAVLQNTTMKAMLIECCFCDNVEDMNRYNPDLLAKAIVEGFLGKGVNDSVSTPNPQPSQPRVENRVSGNDWVRRLQAECNAQGFSNQVVDGIPGVNTLNECPTLRQGAYGNITRLLQEKLVSLGYNTNGIDGDFGGGTANAVRSFQARNGLSQDAIVGKNTWRKLLGL